MAMSFTDYQQAVRGHLDDRMAVVAAATKIYWPNLDEPRLGGVGGTEVAKPVPGDPAWIMADVQTDDNLRTANGGGTSWETLGALMVQVFGSRNVGTGEVEALSETVATELRDVTLLGGKLAFENVMTVGQPTPDPEGWWMGVVRGEFSYLTT